MVLLTSKLSQSTIDGDLMKHFAKLQVWRSSFFVPRFSSHRVAHFQGDENPGIRTNTVVCLGKIAKHISPSARESVLGPAFLRVRRMNYNNVWTLPTTLSLFSRRPCKTDSPMRAWPV